MSIAQQSQSALGAFIESALHARDDGAPAALRNFLVVASGLRAYDPDLDLWSVVDAVNSPGGRVLVWHRGELWGISGGPDLRRFQGETLAVGTYDAQLVDGPTAYDSVQDLLVSSAGDLYCLATTTAGAEASRVFQYSRATDSWTALGAEIPGRAVANGLLEDTSGTLYVVVDPDVGSDDMIYSWSGAAWIAATVDDGADGDLLEQAGLAGSTVILIDAYHPAAVPGPPRPTYAAAATLCQVGLAGGDAEPIDNTFFGPDAGPFEYRYRGLVGPSLPAIGNADIDGKTYLYGIETDEFSVDTFSLLRTDGVTVEVVGAVDDNVFCVAADPLGAAGDLWIGGRFTDFAGVAVTRWTRLVAGVPQVLAAPPGSVEPAGMVILFTGAEPPVFVPEPRQLVPLSAYSRQLAASNSPEAWRLAEGPAGATGSGTGLVEWASPTKPGPHTFKAYAGNAAGWDTVAWEVYPQDVAPTINALSDDSWFVPFGDYLRAATLSVGDTPVDWVLVSAPAGFTITEQPSGAGHIECPQAAAPVDGVYTITVRATNGAGFDEESFDLTVTN